MKEIFSLSFVVIFLFTSGYAQTKVTGTVSNNKNKPLSGAMIYLDSINSNVTTDKKGRYSVMLMGDVKTIHVYSPKYGLLSHDYNEEEKIDFVYIDGRLPANERLDTKDRVAIGYNEENEKYMAMKVEQVDAEERIDATRFLSIYDLIRDRVSGVRVSSDNKITIRGVNSLISSQDPLFVVDGNIVSSIDYILPVDVDKISVLKGTETSMYGTRGANGVIVIKTKK
ncbi:TonB-dependent receptor plug domain-containing protein [Aureitalea sp. L0-47]|uniref:TonB-dependent receptor plug domain-containing protein n=1 Tax=Aureitalea sp. L0-47 TaxID=2816962 RepID=UPI0022387ABC|nr:TonB-dependent receptor plug domain-containing protein [Aureitalea sp. L0-47]MCW5519423.1 TonB-dependent receptor plug domain-containing protein [Aureitalea sp. L0-47]